MATRFTAKTVENFTCQTGKQNAFIWDDALAGLGVKASRGGAKRFVFAARLTNGQTIRMTIGDVRTWVLADARAEARRLQTLIDQGRDPRQHKAEKAAADQRHAH